MNAIASEDQVNIDHICINTIRTLAMDAVQQANSGHPGAPMGLAAVAYVLWTRVLKHNPRNPEWIDRDRFVLSAGHASMLLYSLLYLTGYDVSLEDIKNFRQWGSNTPGHPEFGHTPGVETTTGPLGQGFANAVGMAMAERHLAACFNRPPHDIVDHHTYIICGDGDLMEGVSAEAASLAGHLGLARLICIYDDNNISIEGRTDITFTEDVVRRFEAYHWHTLVVDNGNDVDEILAALASAKAEHQRPSLIALRTQIAYGSPNKQNTAAAHGAPLGEEEVLLTKKNLGWPEHSRFHVPDSARNTFRKCIQKGEEAESNWQGKYAAYAEAHPDLAKRWADAVDGRLADGWDDDLPEFNPADGPIATRAASGIALNALANKVPTLIGGSADLAPSNKTHIEASFDFQKNSYDGRNIRFGVREHAMGAILSGMQLHKGCRPYGGTFLVFADYMRPSIRLASLMQLPVIYVFTHDSIAVGEDGPTHQPIEHLATLRAIPGLTVIRPADASETVSAWRQALKTTKGPVALILSRQKLPVLPPNRSEYGLAQGAYIVADSRRKPDIIIVATGSEVHIALEAQKHLADQDVAARVVSMPSWELFDDTTTEYRHHVLVPDATPRLVIEAGTPMGWERYAGKRGMIIGITRFGASAPGGKMMEKYGFTVDTIVEKAMALL
jgi:transketolase